MYLHLCVPALFIAIIVTGICEVLPKDSIFRYIIGMLCVIAVCFWANPIIGIGMILLTIVGLIQELASKKIDTSKKQEIKPYSVTNTPYIRIKEDGKYIEYKMVNGRMETTQI